LQLNREKYGLLLAVKLTFCYKVRLFTGVLWID